MYERDRATRHLGIEIGEVGPGRATARMRVTGEMVNGHDIAHGGYVFLLADTAFAFACNTYDKVTVAAAAEVVFVRPARLGDELVAEAVERTRYGRSGIYDVTVRLAAPKPSGGLGPKPAAGPGDGVVIAEFRGHSRSQDVRMPGGSG
jgi:acyl-CoA thioesterase